MITPELIANVFAILSISTVVVLAVLLIGKMERVKQLDAANQRLKDSLDEMDEQAKLIVRTDMELNKIQEELDKKVTGLYALQSFSREMSTTLEENQIFKILASGKLTDLGFEKAVAFLFNESDNTLKRVLTIGYSADDVERIEKQNSLLVQIYTHTTKEGKTLSSAWLEENTQLYTSIVDSFLADFFIICPILPKDGTQGFLFTGIKTIDSMITPGDEELITILANQIGQSLENARLFEKTWKAQHDLETKVIERTNELRKALEEVKQINKQKTDFISSVSHELRTPLTSVKGYAAILISGKLGAVPEPVLQRLEKINHHTDELVHMVNDLLDIARIESGKMTMKLEPLSLNQIIDGAIDLLSVQARTKTIELKTNLPSDSLQVYADHSQINRVFINLIGNALKFTPEHGTITVTAQNFDDCVQINISDTGCGIPADALDEIFEEFYRVDNAINQEVKGTGLGLSLVKKIIEAHKGKIWARSELKKGSTFSFTIPKQI